MNESAPLMRCYLVIALTDTQEPLRDDSEY